MHFFRSLWCYENHLALSLLHNTDYVVRPALSVFAKLQKGRKLINFIWILTALCVLVFAAKVCYDVCLVLKVTFKFSNKSVEDENDSCLDSQTEKG